MLAHTTLRGATTPLPVLTYMRLSVSHRASECPIGRHHRLLAPSGYPQTSHSMQARIHSSDGPWEYESVSQSHSRSTRLSVMLERRMGLAHELRLPWAV